MHACDILTFDTDDKNKIQEECDTWGDYNCDPYERGGRHGGLGSNVRFTDRIFDTYEEAVDYLDKTFGDYKQTAVRYRKYPKKDFSKTVKDIERRIKEYCERIKKLEMPHYEGVTAKTVKCKKCGSSLATEYCGKSWGNICPICRADMRPQSSLDKLNKYKETIKDLQKKLREEQKKELLKMKAKSKLCWAVAVEVHC